MPTREGWVNVYDQNVGDVTRGLGVALGCEIHASEAAAKASFYHASHTRFATVKIEWFESAAKKETYDVVGVNGYGWAKGHNSLEAARSSLAEAQQRGVFRPYRIVKITEEEVG